jgi:hypothetical protein
MMAEAFLTSDLINQIIPSSSNKELSEVFDFFQTDLIFPDLYESLLGKFLTCIPAIGLGI